MSAATAQASADWLDGWNAGVGAAAAVIEASDLPIELADHAIAAVRQLLTD